MRFACACLLVGCGFPNVALDKSIDATVDSTMMVDASDAGVSDTGASSDADADSPPPVTKGCKTNGDCALTCAGKPLMCSCQVYLADSAPPFCDSLCMATGCLNKMVACTEAGVCILQ